MPYCDDAYQSLLAVKGVGKVFIARLIEMGLDSPNKLANSSVQHITEQGAKLTGSTCYKNSPQAKEAAANAIAWATLWCKEHDSQAPQNTPQDSITPQNLV